MTSEITPTQQESVLITPAQLLEHWQGHRRLTRRVIEAFPEKDLFSFSIGGMRPFSALAMEMIGMAVPTIQGIASGTWATINEDDHKAGAVPATKQEILELWDQVTTDMESEWPKIPMERFQVVEAAFGQYLGTNYSTLLYIIDNEIHHRGQGYVYLRALGIEPPFFWER